MEDSDPVTVGFMEADVEAELAEPLVLISLLVEASRPETIWNRHGVSCGTFLGLDDC